jgi:hypothetical protein
MECALPVVMGRQPATAHSGARTHRRRMIPTETDWRAKMLTQRASTFLQALAPVRKDNDPLFAHFLYKTNDNLP